MKAERLFRAIGLVDEGLIEAAAETPAKKRPVWRRYAAAAACLMVLCGAGAVYLITGGFRGYGASAGGSGINNAGGAADAVTFMSYAGPVLPLTTAEENPGVTAERHTDWDFTPRTDPEGYDSQWGATVTDSYVLRNPTDTDVTLTLLYPIAGGIKDLLSIDPSVTVNGEKAETELVIGDYAGGFGGAGGGDTSTLNLRYPSQWTDYQALLDGGDYRETVTGTQIPADMPVTVYTFTDKPATVTHTHTASGKDSRTEAYTYSYDHADRLSKVEHTLGGAKVTLAAYAYDNLGRLQSKSLHGSDADRQAYAYNVRGWLTGISGTKFTQNLYYNTGNGPAKYNGSISSMTWKAGTASTVRGYKSTYDGLDRLLNATYGETAGISTNANRFSENVTGYDKNGNIKGLQRYGQTGASAYGLLDNLTYTLTGNQLSCVEDAVSTAAYGTNTAFVNGASAAGEYAYDVNGNLTKDLNKGIADIQYNVLNLPSTVSFSDGSTITYTYGADGTKLRTVHKIGSTTTTTDYCGNVIYENGTQKLLLTEEGYINLAGTQQYHYYLKDHQGNNRVVINQSGTVEETNHYYPFGGVFGTTGNTQPYKYNGKELDTKQGLNWYDYGARHYDAALGRFTTNDPLAEKYYSMSPYTYCADNPVKFIDPNGMEYAPGDLFKTKRAAAKDWGMYYNGASIIRKREMGSSIYEVKQKGKLKGYSYSAANEGEHSVSISLPPNGERFVGSIHSHGDADAEHINNKFSKADIKYIEKTKENGYLATPSGDLLEYNPYSKKTSIVTSDLPSDPKDPKRKNNINPKDIPAEKGKQRMKELLQKPDLNIPVSQREHIHWVF